MNKKSILTIIIGITLLSNTVLAIPGIPNQFYGFVTYNGQTAPDGLSVVAKITGVDVANTTTSDGKYGYDPIFYIEDPNNDRVGETINFFVDGVDTGQTAIFQNGGSTRLNLSFTSTVPTTTTTTTMPFNLTELIERVEVLENQTQSNTERINILESVFDSLKYYVNLIICKLLPRGLRKEVSCPVY